tara:strand:- start:151 stop:285 length:135 start_codon:yes stop_codon:yes gene_type:complete
MILLFYYLFIFLIVLSMALLSFNAYDWTMAFLIGPINGVYQVQD